MDVRLTFDDVVDVYERVRPSYPPELFDVLFAALPEQPQVLELGPGTGQATVDLLRRGAVVTAVELGPNLATRLRDKFGANEHLEVINASFEHAPVARNSFDAVTVATAYHWVEPRAQLERPSELLRPGGVLGVIDLIQVDSDADKGYFERVQPIYQKYGKAHTEPPRTYESAEPPMATRLAASDLYSDVQVHRERWDQTYSAAGYRDLLWSYSVTQMMPEPERTELLDQLIGVIDDEFDGVVTRPLVATLTMATAL